MKLFALVAALVAALSLCLAAPASATTTDPRLDDVASTIAGHSVSALCYAKDEAGAPESYGAWGYTYLWEPVIHLDPDVCEGALGLANADPNVPDWKKGLGALVLTHEAYHQAWRYPGRGDEARTECRAIRHVRYSMLALGATPEVSESLMGWALSFHWRIAARAPEYDQKDCVVPKPY